MLTVISPAKRLDWSEAAHAVTKPAFEADATSLAKIASRLSVAELMKLMSISEDLAKLNADRFANFTNAPEDLRPAAFAFAGDTYVGLDAGSLDEGTLGYAQDHLRILSGLYGLLRAFDGIRPYRLEMGSRLKTEHGANLYAYWGSRLADALNEQAAAVGTDTLINCASVEYFSAVDLERLDLKVVTPRFYEDKPGGPKIVSFYAKQARGAMARFILEQRLGSADEIRGFETGGYRYEEALSAPGEPAFIRSAAE